MAMEGSRMEEMAYRWMRPNEFCEKPTLVNEKPSRHDVLQGSIGNCWMMATLAGIADYLPQLRQVLTDVKYDPRSSDHDGVFHCCFWHYGQWVKIYVDDCLPVRPDPSAPKGFSLIGARSPDKDVLWVALIEKCLAKFHGSYKSIESREREYGWRLLTGGVPCILDQDKLRRTPADNLFERIKGALEAGMVVTCSHRLQGGGRLHAYTVTGAATHSSKRNVIRVRNPWGKEDDRISWLQTPENWTYTEEENRKEYECSDGEFWVMRGECYREFSQFCIGSFTADYYDEDTKQSTLLEHKFTHYGEWTGTSAAGKQQTDVFKNPKYRILVKGSIQKKKRILIELIPRPVDSHKGVCLYLYKITRLKPFKATLCKNMGADKTPTFLANGCPQFSYNLTPGLYMVIPLTMTKGDEREFCLRVFSRTPIKCKEISGRFFHQDIKDESTHVSSSILNPAKYQHIPGLWKGSLFLDDRTFMTSMEKLTQFHLKVSVETRLSIDLRQEFTSNDCYMKIMMYETDESPTKAIDNKFIEEHRPHTHLASTRVQGPHFHNDRQCVLQPGHTYILIVLAWNTTEDRYFVITLGWDSNDKPQVKSFNTS